MGKWSNETRKRLARARQLIKARKPDDVHECTPAESRLVGETSRWFHDDDNICGLGIGCRYEGTERTAEPAIQVFLHRKIKTLSKRSPKRIRPFKLHGRKVATQIIEIREAHLDYSPGDKIGAEMNPGTIAGVLMSPEGELFALSAAHVLCETFRFNSTRHIPIGRGEWLYIQTKTENRDPAAQLFDRRVFDFTNKFPAQNIDAAIAMIIPRLAGPLQLDDIPYHDVDTPRVGDRIRVVSNAKPNARAGNVTTLDYELRHDQFKYLSPNKRMRPIHMSGMCRADYDSISETSGGAIVRDDGVAVGMHIGTEKTDKGELRVFVDMPRVLGCWPNLELLVNPDIAATSQGNGT